MAQAPIKKQRLRTTAPWRVMTVLVLTLALAFVSLGHRPLQAEAQQTAYLLAGGDWTDICADGPDPHQAADHCAACLIGKGAVAADRSGLCRPGPRALAAAWLLTDDAARTGAVARIHPARAPPAQAAFGTI